MYVILATRSSPRTSSYLADMGFREKTMLFKQGLILRDTPCSPNQGELGGSSMSSGVCLATRIHNQTW